MVLAVKLTFDDVSVKKLVNTMTNKFPDEMGNSLNDFAVHTANLLRKNALNDPLRPVNTPDRQRAAALIKAKRLSKYRSVVKMPQSLVWLDSMKPHFVSLKRSRKLVQWTKNNYNGKVVSGRSRVTTGPRGGVKGYLYVTPHRFVQRSLVTARNNLPNELRKGIRKTFIASGE